MTDVLIAKILRDALMVVIIVTAPVLGAGMLVSLVISVFQAATSIQEQTLALVPKIVVMFLVIMFLAVWIIKILLNYTSHVFSLISVGGVS